MGLFIICLMKEKLFGTKDLGPTSTPCLFFWKLYRTKLNTKQITMQLKQVIQKILKHVMNKMLRIMNINKHKLSKNITKHCKTGAPTAPNTLNFFWKLHRPSPTNTWAMGSDPWAPRAIRWPLLPCHGPGRDRHGLIGLQDILMICIYIYIYIYIIYDEYI